MGRRRWDVLGATVVALALVTAGCGSGGVDEAEPAPTTVAPSTTTVPTPDTTVLSDEDAVLAAYQGYWDTWLAANDPPDPNHPDLERYSTGAALVKDRESVARHRLLSQAVRLPVGSRWSHDATVESLTEVQAVVIDCSVDDSLLVDRPSGRVLNDAVGTYRLRALVQFEFGLWRVSSVEAIDEWDGVAGCAG